MEINAAQSAEMDAAIGERIHQLMWRTKLPQSAIAGALGLDQAAISRRLRGRTAWKATELIIIASLLDVPVSELFDAAAFAGKKADAEFRCTRARMQHRRLRIVRRDEVDSSRSYPIRTAS